MPVSNYRELHVWKLGKQIVVDVYRLTKRFPSDEQYGLISQMRRAAVSIPSNIAEGFYRYSKKEFKRFIMISLGSCAELETQVEIGQELGYVDLVEREKILGLLDHEVRMLKSLSIKL